MTGVVRRSVAGQARTASLRSVPGRTGTTSLRLSVAERARTTPGRLRLLTLALVAVVVLAWVVDIRAVDHRRAGIRLAGRRAAPLVVDAQGIQTALNDADASVSSAFLAGGIEPAGLRDRYDAAIGTAGTDLADAAALAGPGGAGAAQLRTIAQQVPVYTGLVEQARAGNRQGFPVGAAYLRDASALLRAEIIPAAAAVAESNAAAVDRGERATSSASDVWVVLLAALLVLAVLVGTQWLLLRRTHRAVNPGLAAATVVVIAAAIVVLASIGSARTALVRGNDRGYRAGALLARAQALSFRAKSDESQALIARGTGQQFLDDFQAAAAAVSASLQQAASADPQAAGSSIQSAWDGYRGLHVVIAACDAAGQHDAAVALALGTAAPPGAPGACANGTATANGTVTAEAAYGMFEQQVAEGVAVAQKAFQSDVASAQRSTDNLALIIGAGAVLAAVLALAGAQARINEYR